MVVLKRLYTHVFNACTVLSIEMFHVQNVYFIDMDYSTVVERTWQIFDFLPKYASKSESEVRSDNELNWTH